MNKALAKYGKVGFKSIIPERLKSKKMMRTILAAQIAITGNAQVMTMANSACGGDVARKKIAIADAAMKTQSAIAKCLTRKDHPIHFEDK